ncbi:hypothetical protein [Macrococcus animalis]|uniref:hypothetical protein n=1 Tax=Macrococcus animalis TaxID=3395467 RepID=UPI0039BDA8EF
MMLSNEAEHFLLQLRLELASKGKKDEDIDAIEEELRDHLYEAELRGESVESVTGGSVKEYIKSISSELPFDKGIFSFLFLMLISILALIAIPRLISGDLDLSVYRVIFYAVVILVLAPLELWILKSIVMKHGDSKTTYIYGFIISILMITIFTIGELLMLKYPSESLASIDDNYSLIIGLLLSLIYLVICILTKSWFFIAVLFYIILPELVPKIFTSGDPKSEDYINASIITYTVMNVIFGTLAFIYFRREGKKDKVK